MANALKRRGSLTIWFDPAMTWEAAPTGKRGRQPDYSDAAIQTCLTMKVLSAWRSGRSSHGNATGPSAHGEEGLSRVSVLIKRFLASTFDQL